MLADFFVLLSMIFTVTERASVVLFSSMVTLMLEPSKIKRAQSVCVDGDQLYSNVNEP